VCVPYITKQLTGDNSVHSGVWGTRTKIHKTGLFHL